MKYLIVNSDDFGMSEGVSRGIIEGHLNGIVTSTTTMINMPNAEQAIKDAQKSAPNLGIGLHLNLSFGQPVSPPESVPSLVTDQGRFVTNYPELMAKMPSFTDDDLERELTAQLERFRSLAGRLPTHMDSHHGSTYYHPTAFDIMVRLAMAHDLPIRWSDSRGGTENALYDQLSKSIKKHGTPRRTDHFVDLIFGFESHSRLEPLEAGLKRLQDGYTELMVHVGYGENLDEAYTFQREEELSAITDPGVKQVIEDEGIQLVNFGDLPK